MKRKKQTEQQTLHSFVQKQVWRGHADIQMVMSVYTKLTAEKEKEDALKLNELIQRQFCKNQTTQGTSSGTSISLQSVDFQGKTSQNSGYRIDYRTAGF